MTEQGGGGGYVTIRTERYGIRVPPIGAYGTSKLLACVWGIEYIDIGMRGDITKEEGWGYEHLGEGCVRLQRR